LRTIARGGRTLDGMSNVAKVVTRRSLHDRTGDAAWWRSRPPAERLAMLERLRARHHGWDDGTRPELPRVHRVISLEDLRSNKRAAGCLQDLADFEALEGDD